MLAVPDGFLEAGQQEAGAREGRVGRTMVGVEGAGCFCRAVTSTVGLRLHIWEDREHVAAEMSLQGAAAGRALHGLGGAVLAGVQSGTGGVEDAGVGEGEAIGAKVGQVVAGMEGGGEVAEEATLLQAAARLHQDDIVLQLTEVIRYRTRSVGQGWGDRRVRLSAVLYHLQLVGQGSK